jgi:hypothetical protein
MRSGDSCWDGVFSRRWRRGRRMMMTCVMEVVVRVVVVAWDRGGKGV